MAPSPEQRARETIDALLAVAGWAVQDVASTDLHAARGVAIRKWIAKQATAWELKGDPLP